MDLQKSARWIYALGTLGALGFLAFLGTRPAPRSFITKLPDQRSPMPVAKESAPLAALARLSKPEPKKVMPKRKRFQPSTKLRQRPSSKVTKKPPRSARRKPHFDFDFESDPEGSLALNVPAPLDDFVGLGLGEKPQMAHVDPQLLAVEGQIDTALWIDTVLPAEEKRPMAVLSLQKNRFEKEQTVLAQLKESAIEAPSDPVRLAQFETPPTVAKKLASQQTDRTLSPSRKKNQLVAAAQPPRTAAKIERNTSELSAVESLEVSESLPTAKPLLLEQKNHLVRPKERVAPTLVRQQSTNKAPSTSPLPSVVAGQPKTHPGQMLVMPAPPVDNSAVAKKAEPSNPEKNLLVAKLDSQESVNQPIGGKLYGLFQMDKQVADWLEKNQGHVSLRLTPVTSRAIEDTIYIPHDLMREDFDIDATQFKDAHYLWADFFAKGPSPVARVPYQKAISAENHKERIRFYVDWDGFTKAQHVARASAEESRSLTATLFKVGAMPHRDQTKIEGAQVEVVNHPELGSFRSDSQGNVHIEGIPSNSELLLRVKAPGHYTSYPVVPVRNRDAYQSIYLIPEGLVQTVTKDFSGRDQQLAKGLVLGRLFDPRTYQPKEGGEVFLSGRKSWPIYFHYLSGFPDIALRAATKLGLFAFFNATPSFRTLQRPDRFDYLTHIRAGAGTYVDLGRTGLHSLTAVVTNPFTREPIDGTVHLIGNSGRQFSLNAENAFRIDGIDFPAGLVTLEFNDDNGVYPKAWLNIGFIPHETKRAQFYLIEKTLVDRFMDLAKISPDPDNGQLIGGAESALFAKGVRCVLPHLYNESGKKVANHLGPATLQGQFGRFCLTRERPGFAYYNLKPGEYVLKLKESNGAILRSHVLRVGRDRVTFAVN